MTRSASPLRYPGGKASLFQLFKEVMHYNGLEQVDYIEPYSGGCGLALNLLFGGFVSNIHLNDLDRSIWAFWHSVLYDIDAFLDLVAEAEMSICEWNRQKKIQKFKTDAPTLELGFSTFYLNRTNRSGIIHSGGVIGGNVQAGAWKLDCRFNKPDLIDRLQRVNKYRGRISLHNQDAELFIRAMEHDLGSRCVAYIDPPYYEKGSSLYHNAYCKADHARLAKAFQNLAIPWLLTYDNATEISNLYGHLEIIPIEIGYSAQVKRTGSELLVFSKALVPPPHFQAALRAA